MRIGSLRSVYRVNVRVITALCFLCALLAAGWVAWRVASWVPQLPSDTPASFIPPPSAGEWHRSDTPEPVWAVSDPFTSPYIEARLAEEKAARAAEEARRVKAAKTEAAAAAIARTQAAKAKAAAPVAASPKPAPQPATPLASPKPPRTVTLVYRGMLTRTDGTSVAIIEQAPGQKTTLLETGESIEGFSMARLDRTTAMLMGADGKTEHPLPVGKKITLTPGKQKQ